MTTRRRLQLFVLVLAWGTTAAVGRAAETDKYLPNRTEAVVTVNVKQLLEAPLCKDNLNALRQALKGLNVGQMLGEQFGIDPFQDVDRIVAASGANPDQEGTFVLVQGSFDNAKVQAALDKAVKENKDRVRIQELNKSYKVYEVRLEKEADTPCLVALLDPGVAVIGTRPDLLIEVLDKKAGKRQPDLRKDVQQLLAKADPKHAVSIVALSRPLNFAGLLGNLPGNLQNVTGGLVFTEDIKVELALSAADVQNARAAANQLEESLNQAKVFVAVLVTQRKELSPLADLLAGVKVSAKGNDVAFRLTVNKDLLDSLFKKDQ